MRAVGLKELEDKVIEQKRMKLLQRLHLEYLHYWVTFLLERHYEEQYLEEVIKKRHTFFTEEGEEEEDPYPIDNKTAIDRWKEIRLTFKWTN